MVIKGIVVTGFGEGRQSGYPTANLRLDNSSDKAEAGIYAGWVVVNNQKKAGILIVGVYGDKIDNLRHEVYIIDWSEDVYGAVLEFHLVKKIRDIFKPANQAALIEQIKIDVEQAEKILAS